MTIDHFFRWAERRGYSLKDIAEALEYDFSTVYKFKMGRFHNLKNFRARAIVAYGMAEVGHLFDLPPDPTT